MNGRVDALRYLIARTTRNRVVKQLSRVRNPRYAFALLFGIGYLYLSFLRPGMAAPASGNSLIRATDGLPVSGLLFLTVAITWLFSRSGGSLAFLPAEVQFLLPGPLSRRQLLGYRMVRAQLVVLLNALIWTIVLRKFGVSTPPLVRFITAWGVFTFLSLHQLGAALVLVKPATPARRLIALTVRGVMLTGLVLIAVGLVPTLTHFGETGFQAGLKAIQQALSAAPVSSVLAPFRLFAMPLLVSNVSAALSAFGVVLLIIAGHVAWIFAMDVEFADIAVAASAKRATKLAAMRAARSGNTIAPTTGKKASRTWIPLNPTGPALVAIAWKNTIALFRGGGARTVVTLVLLVFLLVASRTMSSGTESADRVAIFMPYVMIMSMSLLVGPRLLRNDLRQDLLRIASLKTYPLSGSALVLGEVASPTLLLTGFQLLILVLGYFTMPEAATMLAKAGYAAFVLVLLPFLLLALNGVNVVIQNGITVMFPSWVRLGADSGGVEAMGQNLLVTFGGFLALTLALLVPGGAAVALAFFIRLAAGVNAFGAGIAVGALMCILLLAGEIFLLVGIFGRSFERIDPTQIN